MPAAKILIVDDDRLIRWSLRQKCEEWGFHAVEAEAGEPGLKLAQRESPDLILLDVRMPDITGLEVLDQLKKSGDTPPVIMITADPQLDDVKAALKLGAYDFVGKPLDFDETPCHHQECARDDQLAHPGAESTGRGSERSRIQQRCCQIAEDG